jgi:hypothetical protein
MADARREEERRGRYACPMMNEAEVGEQSSIHMVTLASSGRRRWTCLQEKGRRGGVQDVEGVEREEGKLRRRSTRAEYIDKGESKKHSHGTLGSVCFAAVLLVTDHPNTSL